MNYNIEGEPLPVVICNLEANETMITEKGAMSWMTPNMKMETTSNGGIGKMFDRAFLAAMTGSCQLEIQTVPGIKNVVFGGEGLFNTVVTGPGRVWLQSMPVSQLAGAIRPFIPTGN